MTWPAGVCVGHTNKNASTLPQRDGLVILDAPRTMLTPAEARAVAAELLLRADFQDRTPDTYLENEIPRRGDRHGR